MPIPNFINPMGITRLATSEWIVRSTPVDNNWTGVEYGEGLYVAVSNTGTNNRVMTSTDGINWTIQTSLNDNYSDIVFGRNAYGGYWFAVADGGSGKRGMKSTNGTSWSESAIPYTTNTYRGITFGTNTFAAVSSTGQYGRVVTNTDITTWAARNASSANSWQKICYGKDLFVAVANNQVANAVMRSADKGATWNSASNVPLAIWNDICFGNNLFVAVGSAGAGNLNRIMTSSDAVTWTLRASPVEIDLQRVVWAKGLFVAVANTGVGNRCIVSTDGINWTVMPTPIDNNWTGLCYGDNKFVAVASSGTGSRVMTMDW